MIAFKLIRTLKVGDRIQATKGNRKIIGVVVKLHPGAAVIVNERSEQREVVDSDKIDKIIKDDK